MPGCGDYQFGAFEVGGESQSRNAGADMSGMYDYKAVIDALWWIGRLLAVNRAWAEICFCRMDTGLLYVIVSLGDNNGSENDQGNIFAADGDRNRMKMCYYLNLPAKGTKAKV